MMIRRDLLMGLCDLVKIPLEIRQQFDGEARPRARIHKCPVHTVLLIESRTKVRVILSR